MHTSAEFPRPAPGAVASVVVDYESPALKLWAAIPSELAEKLRPMADYLVEEVLREIQRTVPAYSQPLRGRFGEVFVGTVKMAVYQCFDNICQPQVEHSDWKAVFGYAGRAEFVAGRTTDPLQAAVRVGARVVWRYISANAHSLGIPTEPLFTVAEAIFAWMEELSAVAIEGHQEAQAKAQDTAMDAQEQSRRHLSLAILSGEPAAQEWVRALGEAAGWPLPDRLVTIAVERGSECDDLSEITGHREALVAVQGMSICVLLPDPGGNRRLVSDLLAGRRAAVGPIVTPTEANRSFALARRLLGLMLTTGQPPVRIAWCQDHLATLLLLADPFLTAQLHEHTEVAFAELTPKQRDRMATTLLAWLRTRGTHNEIAARLDVHPQTIRYRIQQLQQLLGDKLNDPDARLTMELALRAHMLLNPQSQQDKPANDQLSGVHWSWK